MKTGPQRPRPIYCPEFKMKTPDKPPPIAVNRKARFDYFIARSIWTHSSKAQIETTLDGFVRDTGDNGVFLASYLPAQTAEEDYQGTSWVGTSHESDVPGVVRHSLAWLTSQCERRGLRIEQLDGVDCDSQYWLKLSKQPR